MKWRHEIEEQAANSLQPKYADDLVALLARSDELNAAVEEMHNAVRVAGLADDHYPARAMATLILGVRGFHAAKGIACLVANGNGAESRPLSRQLTEIVSIQIDLDEDESGQRARCWLLGEYHTKPTGSVTKSFGANGLGLYGYLSDDAHGRPAYLGLEVLRRLQQREHVWIPLADDGEDLGTLRLACAHLHVLSTGAECRTAEVNADLQGEIVRSDQLAASWSTEPDPSA